MIRLLLYDDIKVKKKLEADFFFNIAIAHEFFFSV